VIKVIEHCRKLRNKVVEQSRFDSRLAHLRSTIYDRLLEVSEDPSTFPLFADFCLLPSVVTLFDPSDTTRDRISSHKWKELRKSIGEESEDWFESIRLAATKLVLSRTLDLEEDEQLSEDPAAYSVYLEDEDWYDLVQSFVCCDITGCQTVSKDKKVFFGSIYDLVKHQHEAHSDLAPKFKLKKDSSSAIQTRFSLPLSVAAAVSDLLSLGELDEASAKENDVDGIIKDGTLLQWEDAPGVGFGKSKKDSDWKKIVSFILHLLSCHVTDSL
jgi:hypothetical protein